MASSTAPRKPRAPKGGTLHSIEQFDTFNDLLDRVFDDAKYPQTPENRASRRAGGGSWDLDTNWDAIVGLTRSGWEAGAAQVEAALVNTPRVMTREMFTEAAWDVVGDYWDMGLVCAGLPECAVSEYETEMEVQSKGKLIRIQCESVASAGVPASTMAARGAALVALVDALERSGKRVEVVITLTIECPSNPSNQVGFEVTAKAFDQPVQMDQLAFMLMHPTMLRRLGFAWMEQLPEHMRKAYNISRGGSYGMCGTRVIQNADVVVPGMDYRDRSVTWSDPESVRQWQLAILKNQGLTIEADAA